MKKSVTLNDFFLLSHIEIDEWLDKNIIKSYIPANEIPSESLGVQNFKIGSVLASPGKCIMTNIMGYARALYVVKTQNAGIFNILMN